MIDYGIDLHFDVGLFLNAMDVALAAVTSVDDSLPKGPVIRRDVQRAVCHAFDERRFDYTNGGIGYDPFSAPILIDNFTAIDPCYACDIDQVCLHAGACRRNQGMPNTLLRYRCARCGNPNHHVSDCEE